MFILSHNLQFLPSEGVKINIYPISSIGQKCINFQYDGNLFMFENVMTTYKMPRILLTPNYFRMKRELSNNNVSRFYFPFIYDMNDICQCKRDVEILFRGSETYASLKKVKEDFNLMYINNKCIKSIRRMEYPVHLEATRIIVPWVDTPTIPLYHVLLQASTCCYMHELIFDLSHSENMQSFKELYEVIDLLNINTSVIDNYLHCYLPLGNTDLFNKILNFDYKAYWNRIINNDITIYNSLTEFIQEEVDI